MKYNKTIKLGSKERVMFVEENSEHCLLQNLKFKGKSMIRWGF